MSVFVDTNVLVYARDAGQPEKQPVAREWMDRLWDISQGRLSVQVLNEYYVTVTRKLRPGMSPGEAQADVNDLMSWNPLPVTADLVARAWVIEARFNLQFWDALIIAAAQHSGCEFVLTEDLNEGQNLGGVVVVNPFVRSPGEILPV